jgi:peptidoglycan/xylan/chitin deacetylase (PgdA/CDA1 family)
MAVAQVGLVGRVRLASELSHAQGVTRRTLLNTVHAAAVAAVVADGAFLSGAGPTHARLTHRKPAPSKSNPPPAIAQERPAPSLSPKTVQTRPIRTLAQYRALIPGPAFPANAVALTIDDGPHPRWTPPILGLLDKYHLQATFCMIGNQVRGHEAVARSVVASGHHVANHTWSHPLALDKQTPYQVHRELTHAQDKIYSTTSEVPKLFRSPGGNWSPALLAQTAEAGLIPIDWSDDPRDWSRPGVQVIINKMLAAEPGEILLCHDGGGDRSETYTALQQVIPALLARGYVFVSL